ncbi:hypothetical protein CspHIS471_0207280 [Cutaneotrichosporon sp. HIS471]|nr:hypothetical protein CspHIS471_0207280 [Cutaneotrichosporon sp. HIS471]
MAEQRAAQPVASPPKADQPTILELSQEEVAQSAQTVEDPAQQHHDATIHHDATVAAVQAVEQHVQPDAAYAQLQQDQWGGQQYYQVGDHLTGDYSQINGVMPLPGTEHGGEHYESDYSAVAATLSNWAETHPVDQSGAGGVDMVGGNGTGVPLGEQVHNGEVALMSTPLTEKPKKLMLACHFCRGRKLKCDGSRPTCHHCAKRSLACTYDEQVRRRGPGKRTKEMRERAAREAEQAGITALSAEQLAEHLAAHASGTPLGEPPKRAGRKRKSEAIDDEVKKARLLDEDTAAAVAAAQAMHQAEQAHHDVHSLEALSAHEMPHEMQHDLQHDMQHEMQHDMQHEMQHDMSHDMSNIDPALAGADGVGVMDLAPLEPGTLGQVIQQLNGQHQQQ